MSNAGRVFVAVFTVVFLTGYGWFLRSTETPTVMFFLITTIVIAFWIDAVTGYARKQSQERPPPGQD